LRVKPGKRGTKFYVSIAVGLFVVSIALLVALGIMTYRNYRRETKLEKEFYTRKGEAVIYAVQAGIRVGIRQAAWDRSAVQELVAETAAAPEIFEISMVDKAGIVVADSRSGRIGLSVDHFSFPGDKRTVSTVLPGTSPVRIHVSRKLEIPTRRIIRDQCWNRSVEDSTPAPQWMTVVFDMTDFQMAMAEDLRRAGFSIAILLLLSVSSLIFLLFLRGASRTNEALRATEEYVRNVVESLPEGVISLDATGSIETVNKAAAKLLELNPEICIGKPLNEVLPGCGIGQELLASPDLFEYKVDCPLNSERSIPLSLTTGRIHGPDGQDIGILLILKNLADLKNLETKLQVSERMATLGKMAAGIAHEIRNPLSSIKGFSQYFQNQFQKGSDDWNYAAVMIGEVDRLNRVIEDLLNFAKPQDMKTQDVPVLPVVNHVLKLVDSDLAAKKIRVTVKLDGKLEVRGDADMLTQVLLNLILNAVEAMSPGGELGVRGSVSEDRAVIHITDTGPGIADEQLSHVFEPFFTSKKEGTGLGLAIVYRIVENLQGSIDVTSIDGVGTRFTLTFPSGGSRHEDQ